MASGGFQLLAVHQFLQDLFQSDQALASRRFAVLEFDPSFVETIEHLNARLWMLHALRLEKLLPGLARDGLGADGMPDDFGEGRRNLIWRDSRRPFEFNDLPAGPVFLEQF